MKVFEINDQWINNKETSKQLLRVQNAKCHEFFIYFHYLIKKYKLWMPPSMWTKLDSMQETKSEFFREVTGTLNSVFQSCTPEEKAKGKAKFDRMLQAKEKYEWSVYTEMNARKGREELE